MARKVFSKIVGRELLCRMGVSLLSPFLLVAPVWAQENECVFRRGFQYGLDLPLNSNSNIGFAEIQITLDTNAFLFRREQGGTGSPELVESYEVSEDGKTMSIKMRENCGWSDGHPITAENVVAGLFKAFSPEVDAYNPGRVFFKQGTQVLNGEVDYMDLGIRKTGEFSFEIDIEGPPDMMPVVLTRFFTPFPSHLSPEEQDEWFQETLPVLSSGPYMPRVVNEENIILERNPYYCEGQEPVPDIVEIKNVESSAEAVSLFVANKIDFVERFKPREYRPLIAGLDSGTYGLYEQYDEIITYATIFESSPIWDNIELRQALAMMIDYDVIGTISWFEGLNAKANPNISYPYEGYSARPSPWQNLSTEERVEKARALLEKNGYTDENPLKITLATAMPDALENLAFAIDSMWSRIPVETNLMLSTTREEGRDYRANEDGMIDISMDMIGSDYPDPSDFLLSAISYYYADPDGQFGERTDQSFDILDREERFAVLAEIDADLIEEARIIPLSKQVSPWLFQNGFRPTELFILSGKSVANDNCRQ